MAITVPTSITKISVEYSTIKKLITYCQQKKFANGRLFNGYAADRVIDSCNDLIEHHKKTIFDYVNELNIHTTTHIDTIQ